MSPDAALTRRRIVQSLGSAALSATLPGFAAAEGETFDQIRAAAAKEGTFVWYDSIPPDDMKLLIDLFHKAHPEIRLQYIEVAATARMARMVQESNAGGPTADYLTTNPAAILTVAKRGLVRAVEW